MIRFILKGLAEGVVGKSTVKVSSVETLFINYPELQAVKNKLTIKGNVVSGICPCDG